MNFGPIRVEAFASRDLGWDFAIGSARDWRRDWFAIWWCRGCDCGIKIGPWTWAHVFRVGRDQEPPRDGGDADPYAEFRMDAADNGDA